MGADGMIDAREVRKVLAEHTAGTPVMYEGKRTQECQRDKEPWPCRITRWGTILLAVLELPDRWDAEAEDDDPAASYAPEECARELRQALDGGG